MYLKIINFLYDKKLRGVSSGRGEEVVPKIVTMIECKSTEYILN